MNDEKSPRKRKSIRIATPPPGFLYRQDFLSRHEHDEILRGLRQMHLKPVFMRGVYSLRRVAHFGWDYDYSGAGIRPTEPIPGFLRILLPRLAAFGGVDPAALEQVLVNFYPAGAGIGWHRDAPMFGAPVIGLSFLSACPMRFRRATASGYDVFEKILPPGSAYAIGGAARSSWQHGIIKAPSDRFSVTFRTLVDAARHQMIG